MTRNDDFDHTLAAWLRRQAPSQAPDRVLDAALERVATESQRRSWLQRFVGETPMVTATRTATLAAVIGLAAVVGLQFANLFPNIGPPGPSATPSPTPPADCVNPPADVTDLISQTDKVACYGNAALTLDASRVGAGAFNCKPTVEPTWLSCPDAGSLMPIGETISATYLLVAIDPASGVSVTEYFDTNVRVTGHFDDPAAQTCLETEPITGESPRPAAEVIESCRAIFVVTQVVPLEP